MTGDGGGEPAKILLPVLQRADELQKHDHLVAYYCRLYAMEKGLKIPAKERTKNTNALLASLMNQLEKVLM
jgi:vacuolar protein sorting-associated protein VTA1